ncbi:hypothetical protein EDC94DRAFT_627065 [Helicostylum pulchrum]|nr:hypothetical protein EDC94DRAFT_627065 [Helicostylum pulchrum]
MLHSISTYLIFPLLYLFILSFNIYHFFFFSLKIITILIFLHTFVLLLFSWRKYYNPPPFNLPTSQTRTFYFNKLYDLHISQM